MSISWYHLTPASRGTAGTMVSELHPMHARQSRAVLDSGFHAMDSGFQLLEGFWTPSAVIRIPNPGIPDSLTWSDELIGLAGKDGRTLKLGFSQRCLQIHFSTYSQV